MAAFGRRCGVWLRRAPTLAPSCTCHVRNASSGCTVLSNELLSRRVVVGRPNRDTGIVQVRGFQFRWPWEYWLVTQWNFYDKKLVKEHGSLRAAAMWLIRNGASVKFSGDNRHSLDYERAMRLKASDRIESVDATRSSLSWHGFDYLAGCGGVRRLVLADCRHVDDVAVERLCAATDVADALVELHLIGCANVTDAAFEHVRKLRSLRLLKLGRLKNVKNLEAAVQSLKADMSQCEVVIVR